MVEKEGFVAFKIIIISMLLCYILLLKTSLR